MARRGRVMFVGAALVLSLGARQAPPTGDLVDRVLAVAARQIVMLSDVRAFLELGLVEPPALGDPVAYTLTTLIERQLVLDEVGRYVVQEPSRGDVDTRLGKVIDHVGGERALAAVLPGVGFTVDDLRRVLQDDLRIERYLARRFPGARRPTEEELSDYVREHPDEFRTDGRRQTREDVLQAALDRLTQQFRQESIDDWVTSLTLRADVFRVP
ncbi:MAG TPA: hypothetical protein DIU48_14825 [Acidobacteria bacterium]|nr:hypothetical protein [Acidobacteriota bacterium]